MIDLARDISAILRIDLDRWRGIASLGRHTLARPPAPGEWSALDCLAHAVDTEVLFAERIHAILDGAEAFPAFDPAERAASGNAAADPVELVARLARQRTLNEGLLEIVTEADLDKGSRHATLGPATLRQLLHHYPAHDLMHLVQAERALMQAYVPETGPWRHYFADHDVEADGGPTATA